MVLNQNLERVRQQIVLANIHELLQKISRRCFNACIVQPGEKLHSSERDCLVACMDQFLASVQVVSQQYFERRLRQRQKQRLARERKRD
ncbi:mitochondrial import inner membrane translocase subunit Tim13-B [Drosophila serrata]|uniref:mitochondrial import inner membrane translocase subunit Tim13-B n=1 Tax=Drosophila serrata TaxID=7274 RepID=UPI000A1D1ED1|nr:mitochondrial import inner membrane translocase subunit Tim13-B [Drosophila serrata]